MTSTRHSKQHKSSEPENSNLLFIPRVLASLLSLFIFTLGMKAVLTAHFFIRSGRLGVELSENGSPALATGVSLIFWGLIPLALWFSSTRSKVAWALFCAAAASLALLLSASLNQV